MMFSLQEPRGRGRGAEPGSFEVSELVVCGSARMQDKQVSPPLWLSFFSQYRAIILPFVVIDNFWPEFPRL